MTPEKFRECLDKLGLKHTGPQGADTFFEVGERTIRRWASGELKVPLAYSMLLRVMVALRMKPKNVKRKYGD